MMERGTIFCRLTFVLLSLWGEYIYMYIYIYICGREASIRFIVRAGDDKYEYRSLVG
jgi:hypothetical protein